MTTTTVEPRLGARVSVGYALGSLVTGAFSTVPGLLFLPYLTDTLGVAAGLAAVLAFAPKAWNVVLNPVAGRVSDRTRTRFGPRRPFVLFAGLGVGVMFAVMFAGPAGGLAGAAWAAVGYLLTASVFAFFQSPYVAMPAEMTRDYADRTRLMSWRVAGIAVAVLVSGALAPVVVRAAGGGIPGHRAMGLVIGTLVAVGAVAAFLGTRAVAARGVAPASEPSLRRQLEIARGNRPFVRLLVVVTLQGSATGALLAGAVYVAQHVLGNPGATAGLIVAYTLPAVLVLPVLLGVAARADKRTGVIVSSAVFIAAGVAWLAAPSGGTVLVLALTFALGCSNAVQDTFVLAMLPDCIAEDTRRTGRRQAGVFAGLFSGAQGLGFATGPLLFGLVLQLGGYVSSDTGVAAAQSAGTATAVLLGFAVLPAALTALSLLPLVRPLARSASLPPA